MSEFKKNWKAYRDYEEKMFSGWADVINVTFYLIVMAVGLAVGKSNGHTFAGIGIATILVALGMVYSVYGGAKIGKDIRKNGE